MTRPFGMPETPKGRKGWKQNSNGKPNDWALNWSPSNSRLHNDPIQRGGVPWKPQAISLKTPARGDDECNGDLTPTGSELCRVRFLDGCVYLRLFGADQLRTPKRRNRSSGRLLLSESVESVAYNQDPGRGKEGIHDYDQTEARQRNDPKDAGGQAQIGCDLVEHSPQHYETDHEDPEREGYYCIHDFQRGCQYCGRIVGSRDISHPLTGIRGSRIVAVENEH